MVALLLAHMYSIIHPARYSEIALHPMRTRKPLEFSGHEKKSDESGIRTHASGETGALNQRLGPLGHLATRAEYSDCAN